MILHRLLPDGRRLVVPELASGERPRWDEDAYAGLVEEPRRSIELEPLDEALDCALDGAALHDASLDAKLAPAIHRALPLTRREAADPALFRFLTVIHRPDVVRFRWEYRSWATMRARFWAMGTRPDSNLFGRLWWMAELSRREDDYDVTRRVLSRQHLANNLFTRDMANHAPLVYGWTDALEDASAPVIETVARRLQRRLSTLVLESLDEADLRDLVITMRSAAENGASSPAG